MSCPLKEAALDAPNNIAILSKDYALTYAELDRHIDRVPIAQMFAAWRRNESFFPTNPRVPNVPTVVGPPKTLLLYTSGSTDTPKIAVLTLANLIANARSAIQPLGLKPGDQWKLSLPLYHVGGISIALRCILARATLVLDDSPDITHLSYVPTQLYRATPVYKKLRCLLLGGAPIGALPPKHLPVYTTYGLTEMASIVALNGQILPDRELKIAKDDEIWLRGPCLFHGYYDEPPQSDWFPTKDLGRFVNGKLEILGRKDWMFISGGENIQPEEIEKKLLAFPEVTEAAVVPVDDPEWGKRPVAVVCGKAFSLQDMQSRLKECLPKYKIPIALYFLDELPKKNNLKLNRFFLVQYIKNQMDPNRSVQKNSP